MTKINILMIVLFVLLAQGIISAGHFFVYKMITRAVVFSPLALLWLKWGMVFLSFTFLFSMIMTSGPYNYFSKIFSWFSSFWLGTVLWLVIGSFLAWLIWRLAYILNFNFSLQALLLPLLLLAFLLSLYGLWNSYQINVRQVEIPLRDLPDYWLDKKVLLLADTHFGLIRSEGFARRVVEEINKQEPHIILFSGDMYDGPVIDYWAVAEPFKEVKAPLGIVFATGNHEEYRNRKEFIEAMSQAGFRVLENESLDIEGIRFLGINDSDGRNAETQAAVLEDLLFDQPKGPLILLKHDPTYPDGVDDFGIDLQVSGHTHGGQTWPITAITRLIYKERTAGLSRYGNLHIYTTTGAGTWGPPQRIGSNSELVVIKLIKEPTQ